LLKKWDVEEVVVKEVLSRAQRLSAVLSGAWCMLHIRALVLHAYSSLPECASSGSTTVLAVRSCAALQVQTALDSKNYEKIAQALDKARKSVHPRPVAEQKPPRLSPASVPSVLNPFQ
jgi:hypothetical protein